MKKKEIIETVTISLDTYNELRDFKETVLKNDCIYLGYFYGETIGIEAKEVIKALEIEIQEIKEEIKRPVFPIDRKPKKKWYKF